MSKGNQWLTGFVIALIIFCIFLFFTEKDIYYLGLAGGVAVWYFGYMLWIVRRKK